MDDTKELELEEVKEEDAAQEGAADTSAAQNSGDGEASGDGGEDTQPKSAKELDAVYDIPVKLQAVLGHADMQVNQLLKLGRGAVVELDRKVGEAVDIYVNHRLVARGEVVVVDEKLGITMTEIIKKSS